jgi:hypothetical protein
MPGVAGSAASNPIDMHGGLDVTGQTVDGNHASGVAKGFKLASWLREENADRSCPQQPLPYASLVSDMPIAPA